MYAITSLLLIVAVSLLVTRVATVVLVATGMSRSAARFQARSALTGTGFTTREAEAVVNHPVRRKVVMNLMLAGNAGIVAAASSLILGFRSGGGQNWPQVLELVLGLLALVTLSRSAYVDRELTALTRRALRRWTDVEQRDIDTMLDLSGAYSVFELAVRPGDWSAGRTLGELQLRDEGVVVLGIDRSDGGYVGVPDGETTIRPGDTLVVYGRRDRLCELDGRGAGESGERAHEAAVHEQRTRAETERRSWSPEAAAHPSP